RQEASGEGFVFSLKGLEAPLIGSVIDRALRDDDPARHMGVLAEIIMALFDEHHPIGLPDPLQPDEQGGESSHTRSLRRLLARALIDEALSKRMDPGEAAHRIVHDWEHRQPLRRNTAATSPGPAVRHRLV